MTETIAIERIDHIGIRVRERRNLETASRHRPGRSRSGAPLAVWRNSAGPRHVHGGRADDVGGM